MLCVSLDNEVLRNVRELPLLHTVAVAPFIFLPETPAKIHE